MSEALKQTASTASTHRETECSSKASRAIRRPAWPHLRLPQVLAFRALCRGLSHTISNRPKLREGQGDKCKARSSTPSFVSTQIVEENNMWPRFLKHLPDEVLPLCRCRVEGLSCASCVQTPAQRRGLCLDVSCTLAPAFLCSWSRGRNRCLLCSQDRPADAHDQQCLHSTFVAMCVVSRRRCSFSLWAFCGIRLEHLAALGTDGGRRVWRIWKSLRVSENLRRLGPSCLWPHWRCFTATASPFWCSSQHPHGLCNAVRGRRSY